MSNTVGDGVWMEGDPFVGVQETYWSATPFGTVVWTVELFDGSVTRAIPGLARMYVWPVRDGQ